MLLVALLAVVVVLPGSAAGDGAARLDCLATPRAARAPTPALDGLSRSWWVRNRVWMGVAGAFHGEGFRAVPTGQKIGWYRQRPGALRLFARRLDGPPSTFTSSVPCCYGPSGFQPTSLTFGASGCWALTAVVGREASRFTVRVAPATPG
jgi:hypothetical protein